MELKNRRIVVTGGAGFIGSHLVDKLVDLGNEVVVIDNFSSGKEEFLKGCIDKIEIVRDDLFKPSKLNESLESADAVFHLAANPEVRIGAQDTHVHLDQNIYVTYNLLEAMRVKDVKHIGFTSTSTVYGETDNIPTPEDHGPLVPISLYASSKLGCEAMISAYCYTFGMNSILYRFANTVGPRSTHGVTYDFVNKLREDPKHLEILGKEPGTLKSYFYISDCIEGMIVGFEKAGEKVEMFNIGSEDYIDVKKIADIICEEMQLPDVEYHWTGGVDDGRGWIGDVKVMLLSIERLKGLGWVPKYNSTDAIRATAKNLVSGSN
jgi:UDP-glucose 4-epimerase